MKTILIHAQIYIHMHTKYCNITHFLQTSNVIITSVTITGTHLNTAWRHKLLKTKKSRIHSTWKTISRTCSEWHY